jgi:hypothetical protein
VVVEAGTSGAPSDAPTDRIWALGGLIGTAVGWAAVATIFRPAAAVILLAALTCAAASLPVVRGSPVVFSRRRRRARRGRARRAVGHRLTGQAPVFDADLERISAVVSVRPVTAPPAVKQVRPEPAPAPAREEVRPAPTPASRPAPPPPVERPSAPAAAGDDPADAYRQGCQPETAGDLAAAEQAGERGWSQTAAPGLVPGSRVLLSIDPAPRGGAVW